MVISYKTIVSSNSFNDGCKRRSFPESVLCLALPQNTQVLEISAASELVLNLSGGRKKNTGEQKWQIPMSTLILQNNPVGITTTIFW